MNQPSFVLGRRLDPRVTEADCNELIDMLSMSFLEAPAAEKRAIFNAVVDVFRAKIAVAHGAPRTARNWIARGLAHIHERAVA